MNRRRRLIELAYYAGQHATATAVERGGQLARAMRLQVEQAMHREGMPTLETAQDLFDLGNPKSKGALSDD